MSQRGLLAVENGGPPAPSHPTVRLCRAGWVSQAAQTYRAQSATSFELFASYGGDVQDFRSFEYIPY